MKFKKKSRTPMMVWGDLVEYQKPIVRRTLVGDNAHECMYAWVYLTEFLYVKRLRAEFEDGVYPRPFNDYNEFIKSINEVASQRVIDPHFQHNIESWLIAFILSVIIEKDNGKNSIIELGQTFFTLKNKVEFINEYLHKKYTSVEWIGVDNSSFAIDVAKTLQNDDSIKYVTDWKLCGSDTIKIENKSIFTSRFVSSYAFSSTNEFLNFLALNKFENIIIEEPFNVDHADLNTFNHGLPILYFNLKAVIKFARENKFSISLLGAYGDNPASSGRCVNTRLLISKNMPDEKKLNVLLSNFSHSGTTIELNCSETLLERYNKLVKSLNWKSIDDYKRVNPVWSKTPSRFENGGIKAKVIGLAKYYFLVLKYGVIFKIHKGENVREELVRHFGSRYFKEKNK